VRLAIGRRARDVALGRAGTAPTNSASDGGMDSGKKSGDFLNFLLASVRTAAKIKPVKLVKMHSLGPNTPEVRHMRKLLVVAGMSAFALLPSAVQAAPFVIDDFSAAQVVPSGFAGRVSIVPLAFADREIDLSGGGTGSVAAGILSLTDTLAAPDPTVSWDGVGVGDSLGLPPDIKALNFNLSAGGNTGITLIGLTPSATATVYVRLYTDTVSDYATFSYVGAPAAAIHLALASAVITGAFDITNVDAVGLWITETGGGIGSLSLDLIEYGTPEPASLATFGLCGLLGLVAARRRRK